MAQFGWAYVDCADAGSTGSGSEGPPYSLQFVTESGGGTTGSYGLVYYTASYATYAPSTVVLQGDLIVTGAISASTYHIEDIAIIDATGSTVFGDSNDDYHIRTGSFFVSKVNSGGTPSNYWNISSSLATMQTFVKGFGANYNSHSTAAITLVAHDHIIGITNTSAVTVTIPEASTVQAGAFYVIKDEVLARTGAGNNITLTGSVGSGVLIDGEGEYILTGTMPAISLYSNGTNWFVF